MAFLLKRLSFAQLSERNFGGIGMSQGGVRGYYISLCFSARGVGGLPLRRHSLCVHAVFSRVRSLRADILYPRPSLFCEYRPPGRRFLRFFLHMSKKSSKFAAQI